MRPLCLPMPGAAATLETIADVRLTYAPILDPLMASLTAHARAQGHEKITASLWDAETLLTHWSPALEVILCGTVTVETATSVRWKSICILIEKASGNVVWRDQYGVVGERDHEETIDVSSFPSAVSR